MGFALTRGLVVCGVLLAGGSAAWAQAGRVLAELPCPVDEPMGLAVRDDALWIADLRTRRIVELRPTDGVVLRRLEVAGFMPTGLAWQGDTLYSADRRQDLIARRRPDAAADRSPIPYYERWATGMAHDGQSLWVVDSRADELHQLDPDDGTTVRTLPTPSKGPTGVAFDGRHLWVADHQADEIYRVDRRNGRVLTTVAAPGPYPSALAFAGDSLWVADYQQRTLYRIGLADDTRYVEDQPRRVHVSYEVLYRATGTGQIEQLTVHLAAPAEIPGQHLLSELDFTPEPGRFETDRWGQQVAIIELGTLAAGESRSVRWEGDFALYRTRYQLVPERVDEAPMPTDLGDYLADDKKYDLSSSVVRELVAKLTKDETGTYARARAIYEHLTEVIEYDRSSGWNNAAAVLERGTGSCSEYTFALVALLRRAGIPARYVGAVSERGDEASFDDVFHRWAEAYLPGYGWVPIDANAGSGESPAGRGSHFGGRSNRHVVTTIGGGASEYLEWTYNSHETYQSQGSVRLESQPIARYRPLDPDRSAEPPPARAVSGPRRPIAKPTTAGDPAETGAGWAGLALLVGLGLGLGLGRFSQASSRETKNR